jgi:imidazolonepropionase-like amidohydrolase
VIVAGERIVARRIARVLVLVVAAGALSARPLAAQRDLAPAVRAYVRTAAPVIALTNVRVIDGTGSGARDAQTLLIRDGVIAWVGDAGSAAIPPEAERIDLEGRTVLPGFVMVHEHLFYPAGAGMYNELGYSFPRLYLAGGATTIRTGGSMVPYADLNLKRSIDAGQTPGPKVHVTAPYLNGPGLPIPGVKALRDVDDARRMVTYWADEGATSFKAYMQISREALGAAIEAAHARGLPVTGHLCSVTYAEAAGLGIDNLEHGFLASTDFVGDKRPDQCPGGGSASLLAVAPDDPRFAALVRKLVDAGVALTSTLPVFETLTPGRPRAPDAALDAMTAEARDQYLRQRARIAVDTSGPWRRLFPHAMALELAFARAGGLLVTGTDPTGYGGVVAGFANQRALELLVEAGFSPVEAIRVGTLNGARLLRVDDRVGSIEAGKAADLVVVRGNPSTRIADISNVEIVFKDGVGYDPERLITSVRGTVGMR